MIKHGRWIALILLMALCMSPTRAQQPTPLPAPTEATNNGDWSRVIQAIEHSAETAQQNQNGAWAVVTIGLVGLAALLVWRRREPEDKITPTLSKVIAKQDERLDENQDRLDRQVEQHDRFVTAVERIGALTESINLLLTSQAQRYANTDANVNTISTTLADMAANGSKPLQELLQMVKLMDPRITLMSDTQLVNVAAVLERMEFESSEWRKEFAAENAKIIALLEKRRTDTQPVAVPPNGTTPN
jgi:hypothetical protein